MSKINAEKHKKKANQDTQEATAMSVTNISKKSNGGGYIPKPNPSDNELQEGIAWLANSISDLDILRMVYRMLYTTHKGGWIFKDDKVYLLAKLAFEKDYPVMDYARQLVPPYSQYLIAMAKGTLQSQDEHYRKIN